MTKLFLIFLVSGGFLVRLIGLTEHCFWLDEFTSFEIASKSLGSIIRAEGFDSHTPPLYYILISFWSQIFSPDEFGLRFFSVVVDSINILLVFLVFAPIFGQRVAILTTALYAASPYSYYYAQEARMYPLLVLLSISTIGVCRKIIFVGCRGLTFLAAVVLFILGAYTHYYYPLFVVGLTIGMFFHALSERSSKVRFWDRWGYLALWILAGLIAGLCFLPWLSTVFQLAQKGGQVFRSSDPLRLLIYFPYTLFRFSAGYGSLPLTLGSKADVFAATIENLPLIFSYLVISCLFFTLGCLKLLRTDFGRVLFWAIIVPPALAYLISLRAPLLSDRYLSVVFPVFILFVSAGMSSLEGRIGKFSLTVLGAASLFGLVSYHSNPRYGNINWRTIGQLVRPQTTGSVHEVTRIFVNPEYFKKLVASYLPAELEVFPISLTPSGQIVESSKELRIALETGQNFYLIEIGNSESILPIISAKKKVSLELSQDYENGVKLYRIEN